MLLDLRQTLNLLLAGITVAILTGVAALSAGLVGTPPKPVRTAVVQRRPLTTVVQAFGRVQPRKWVTIRSPHPGQIVALPAEEGTAVETGDVLVRLRTDRFRSRLARARARVRRRMALVARRRVDSAQARRRLERQRRLREAGASFDARRQKARHVLREATAELEAARAQLVRARARLSRVEQQGRRLTVRAPMHGVVSELRVDVGERVSGTGPAPGTPMMRIDQLDEMEIRVSVAESDVPEISTGDPATVQIDAHPGRTFSARVVSVARARRGRPSGRSLRRRSTSSPSLFALGTGYPVRLDLQCAASERRRRPEARENRSLECPTLRTGMSGTVRIRVATVDGALAVPRSALTVRREANGTTRQDSAEDRRTRRARPVVFVVRDGVARRRGVRPGMRTETHTQIHSGLQPGAEVVVGPDDTVQRGLSDRDAVAVRSSAHLRE